jgi:hypothetical protein
MTFLIQALISVIVGMLLAFGAAFALVSSQTAIPAASDQSNVIYDGS